GCVLANEVFDNLPFHRVRQTSRGLAEVCVGLEGDRIVEIETPCDPSLFDDFPEPSLSSGQEAVVQVAATRMLDRIARVLATGNDSRRWRPWGAGRGVRPSRPGANGTRPPSSPTRPAWDASGGSCWPRRACPGRPGCGKRRTWSPDQAERGSQGGPGRRRYRS